MSANRVGMEIQKFLILVAESAVQYGTNNITVFAIEKQF
jgi:hypothetical protein